MLKFEPSISGDRKRNSPLNILRASQFLSFVKKEFYHIFRDRRTMFILLGMPVVQIIIFGFALTNEVKNAGIAVLDNSKDVATFSIINEIDASRYFDVKEKLASYDAIESSFK